MAAMYWYYHDYERDTRYYVEAYQMSVTQFANEVSQLLGRKINPSDTSYVDRQRDLDKFHNLRHI